MPSDLSMRLFTSERTIRLLFIVFNSEGQPMAGSEKAISLNLTAPTPPLLAALSQHNLLTF